MRHRHPHSRRAPIGRADDASPRLAAELAEASRSSRPRTPGGCAGSPTTWGGSPARVVSYYDQNERSRAVGAARRPARRAGTSWSSPTRDARGTDPGYRLVVGPSHADVPMTVLPGPSAVTTALVLSGLPTDRFCFEGFLPRGRGAGGQARRAGGGTAHHGLLRGPAPADGLPGGAGRRVRSGPPAGGLPRADQDLRGGPAAAGWPSSPNGRRTASRGEITPGRGGPPPSPLEPADLAEAVLTRESVGLSRKEPTRRSPRRTRSPRRSSTTRC